MIEAVWDNAFKRSYRKRIHRVPHLKNQFREKMELFLEEPFDPHLRTHKLSGKLKGTWAFSINDDYRVVFEFIDMATTVSMTKLYNDCQTDGGPFIVNVCYDLNDPQTRHREISGLVEALIFFDSPQGWLVTRDR